MLRLTSELTGYALTAQDGEIGRAKDFLFDDARWVIRYMVADTGKWIPKRRVLISPIALGQADWLTGRFHIRLTKAQIESAPELDEDAPVSRQYEFQHTQHHGYAPYWLGADLWGVHADPVLLYDRVHVGEMRPEKPTGDSHLRSAKEVTGYHIEATDGRIGHVEDFFVDDKTWAVRYMIIDTRTWLPSPKIILPPNWIDAVRWDDRNVQVSVSRQEIDDAPRYDALTGVTPEYETRLYEYYRRPREDVPKGARE